MDTPSIRALRLLSLTARGKALTAAADPALLGAYIALERRLARPLRDYERMLDELNEALRDVAEEPPSSRETSG